MRSPARVAGSPRRQRTVPGRVFAALAVVIAFTPFLSACTGSAPGVEPGGSSAHHGPSRWSGPTFTPSSPEHPAHCTLSAKAVPSCGVLWGIATHPPTPGRVKAAEKAIGRQVDFVYRYHDVNDVVPDAAERKWVAQGKLLHISIAARDFSTHSAGDVTWAQVAAGRFDASLTRQARGIASLKVPVFVTFEQEANQTNKLAALGTPADFVAAWRHIHDLYARAGVTNAVWTWVMTGSAANLASAAHMWPGNRYVDWISWNVYNFSGCQTDHIALDGYVTFRQRMLIFYNWLSAEHAKLHIDTNKPIMISEVGSAQYPRDPRATADWYAAIPSVLKQYPRIKAVAMWDSTDGYCNFDFTKKPHIAVGVRQAGLDPYLALHGALSHER